MKWVQVGRADFRVILVEKDINCHDQENQDQEDEHQVDQSGEAYLYLSVFLYDL